MMDEIRKEIAKIEEAANRLKTLAPEMPGIKTNADVILVYTYLLKFLTPGGKSA